MTVVEYLQLLNWAARQAAMGKRGRTPEHVPPLLKRLGLETSIWCELVSDSGKLFCMVAAGAVESKRCEVNAGTAASTSAAVTAT